jgi:hypothetical protein
VEDKELHLEETEASHTAIGLVALRGPMHTNGGKIKNSSFFLGVSFLRTTIQKGISMRMLCRQHDSSY